MYVLCLLITCVLHAKAYEKNGIHAVKDYILDTQLHKEPDEQNILNFKKNGIKVDIKVVPSAKNDSTKDMNDDYFPEFPLKDLGKCIIDFSLGCIKKRFILFVETVGRLEEITLLGQDVKLVRNKVARTNSRAMKNDSDYSMGHTLDDFFDSFTLRITLPRWKNKREKNQIDVMLDETDVVERGRKKKGGKCKMMMMGMLMMIKLKLMGLAAMKGVLLGGISLLLSGSMLMSKFGKGGGGGGGPWKSSGGGGGHLKEIVLLTKSSSGHSGSGSSCCGPSDSYGAPPSISYGVPSGGGGGYGGGHGGGGHSGGGGGWGRSFDKQPMILPSHNKPITVTPVDRTNRTSIIGETTINAGTVDYPDYQDYQESPLIIGPSSTVSKWNATNYFHEYGDADINVSPAESNLEIKSTLGPNGRSLILNGNLHNNMVNAVEKNIDAMANTNQPDIIHDVYIDEWQATAEKINSNNVSLSNSNSKITLKQNDIPLLRNI